MKNGNSVLDSGLPIFLYFSLWECILLVEVLLYDFPVGGHEVEFQGLLLGEVA